jgi:uncharacterized protein YukE
MLLNKYSKYIMKNPRILLSVILSILLCNTALADSTNVYTNMKKNAKDIFNGVANDAKSVLSDTSSSFNKLADSSKVSFGSVYKDMKNGIEQMAAALKVGAAHVYQVLIRQQIAKAIMWLVILIVTCVLFRAAWKISKPENWQKPKKDGDMPDPKNGYAILSIFLWVVACLSLIACLFHIDTIVYGFVNPEYGAMTDIVDFINKIKNGSK